MLQVHTLFNSSSACRRASASVTKVAAIRALSCCTSIFVFLFLFFCKCANARFGRRIIDRRLFDLQRKCFEGGERFWHKMQTALEGKSCVCAVVVLILVVVVCMYQVRS